MKTEIAVLLLCGAMAGQSMPSCTKASDAKCFLWSSCSWNGLKYRADGQCWYVWRDGPEVSGNHNNRLTYTCDDKTGKPRSCQKEFDKDSVTQHVLDCIERFRDHFNWECMPHENGGMISGWSLEHCISGKVESSRDFVNKMCSPGGQP